MILLPTDHTAKLILYCTDTLFPTLYEGRVWSEDKIDVLKEILINMSTGMDTAFIKRYPYYYQGYLLLRHILENNGAVILQKKESMELIVNLSDALAVYAFYYKEMVDSLKKAMGLDLYRPVF